MEAVYNLPVFGTQEDVMKGYLTTKQVGEMIGVDPSAIRKRADRGTIEGAIKVGEGFRATWLIPEKVAKTLKRDTRGMKPPKKQGS